MTPLYTSLLIACGSAVGGVARYWLALGIDSHIPQDFPWGTLAVNVLGCLIIGVVVAYSSTPWVKPLLMVGVLGGFTTFSSFGLQTMDLLSAQKTAQAVAYVGLSLMLCLLAVWAGQKLVALWA